jgi:hypothetical protein
MRSVILQNATQLDFVDHDKVIETFAPTRRARGFPEI